MRLGCLSLECSQISFGSLPIMFRSFFTVSSATLASRLLGFVRDILIAATLATGPVADAFFVAFRFPNLFRRLFAEGAFNSAFVPLFTRELNTNGREAARAFAREAFAGLFWILFILTIIAELSMPFLMLGLAPGFIEDPEKFDLAVLLTRITFPYLICMSLVALFSGVLNGEKRFMAAALTPVLLNIVLIGTLSLTLSFGHVGTATAGIWLTWGVFAAGIVQLVVVYIAARRLGYGMSFRRPRWTPAMKRLVYLGVPGLIAGGITQFNILIGQIIASQQPGAVSFLYYADRLYQLPLGVVGIAVGIVLLPQLAADLAKGDPKEALASQNKALEFSLFFTLPAAVALFILPYPIIQVLFERGAFDASDTAATAAALAAFAWGLPAFVLIKVFSPGYFAREDTITPMIYAGISMALNAGLSIALFPHLAHVGIALATTIAGWINALQLLAGLLRRGHYEITGRVVRRIVFLALSALAMGATLYVMHAYWLAEVIAARETFSGFAALLALVVAGAAVFILMCFATGAVSMRWLKAGLKRNSRRRPQAPTES